jgi:APA family basic amino acid/polyamine antiporter/amino acid efflux transporter
LLVAHLKIAHLILLVNQNLLILFLASIRAYAKSEPSRMRWLVVPAALMTCLLFLSGFSVWILFPVVLAVLGIVITRFQRRSAFG